MRPVARLAAAAALVTGLAVLAGCSAGQVTQTAAQRPSVPGVNWTAPDGSVSLLDVSVAYKPGGYRTGGTAPLLLQIANNRQDATVRLVDASSPAGQVLLARVGAPTASPSPSAAPSPSASPSASPGASASASPSRSGSPSPAASPAPAATPIVVKPNGYLRLAPDSGTEYIVLAQLTTDLMPGMSVKVSFTFDVDGRTVTADNLDVPVGVPATPGTRSPIAVPSTPTP